MEIKEEDILDRLADSGLAAAICLIKYIFRECDEVKANAKYDSSFLNRLIAILNHHTITPLRKGMNETIALSLATGYQYSLKDALECIDDFKKASESYIDYHTKKYQDGIPIHMRSEEMDNIMHELAYNYGNELYVMDGDGPYTYHLTKDNCVFYEIHEGRRISLMIVLLDKMSIYELFQLSPMNSLKTKGDDHQKNHSSNIYAVKIMSLGHQETMEDLMEKMTELVHSMSGACMFKVGNPYLK